MSIVDEARSLTQDAAPVPPAAWRPSGRSGSARALIKTIRVAVALIVVAAVWEGMVRGFHIKPAYLPSLSAIAGAVAIAPQAYAAGFIRTLTETLIGMVAGSAFGIAIAIVFFRARVLREMVFPIFIVSQTIPVIAFGALIVLWFGNTLFSKAIIAFYLTFFPVTVNTLLGLESVDPRQEALLRSFGAGRFALLWRLQLPAALPQIFVALRLAASLSLIGAIVGEWFGDTTGMGVLLLQHMFNENFEGLWAALIGSAILGTGLYGFVGALERRIVFWGAAS